MSLPKVALFIYPDIPIFHFSVPHTIFNAEIEGEKLFEVSTFSLDGLAVRTEKSILIEAHGDVAMMQDYSRLE